MFWTNLSPIAPQVLIKVYLKIYAEHIAIACLLIILEKF